jgi:hypothetical protein
MGFETQRHKGTQRSGGSATQSCHGASKALGLHPGKREPPGKSPASHSPLPHTRLTPTTQRSPENCPYRAKLPRGDVTWHFMPG